MNKSHFRELIRDLSQLEEVESILLAGSRAMKTDDEISDYDVYIYITSDIPEKKRQSVAEKYFSYIEINNQFWETEDDGILQDGTAVELIYRRFDWLESELDRVLFDHQASIGYTTCFWSNFLNSDILYDPDGHAKSLQEKYSISYPIELKKNIIRKNYPLLKSKMPAYYFQIKKALQRKDFISVNHRMAAFLASYFDILFAVNEYPHPGEKKLLRIAKKQCDKLPEYFEHNMINLIRKAGTQDQGVLSEIDDTVKNLDALLQQEAFYGEVMA